MKGHFAFAGIPRPKLLKLAAPIFKASAKNPLDWNFVFDLWQEDFREAQYIALEYIGRHHKELVSSDIDNLKSLIVEKSWWETADTIDGFVGELVLKDESLKTTMVEWASDRNLWLRRVAIDFQQRYKDLTDVPLLEKIICLNFGSGEFFINVCAIAHVLPLPLVVARIMRLSVAQSLRVFFENSFINVCALAHALPLLRRGKD